MCSRNRSTNTHRPHSAHTHTIYIYIFTLRFRCCYGPYLLLKTQSCRTFSKCWIQNWGHCIDNKTDNSIEFDRTCKYWWLTTTREHIEENATGTEASTHVKTHALPVAEASIIKWNMPVLKHAVRTTSIANNSMGLLNLLLIFIFEYSYALGYGWWFQWWATAPFVRFHTAVLFIYFFLYMTNVANVVKRKGTQSVRSIFTSHFSNNNLMSAKFMMMIIS